MDANSAVLFVTATGAKLQSLLNYAKALSGIMKHIGMENQPTQKLSDGLKGRRCCSTRITGNSDLEGNPGGVEPDTGTGSCNRSDDRLEDDVTLGGRSRRYHRPTSYRATL